MIYKGMWQQVRSYYLPFSFILFLSFTSYTWGQQKSDKKMSQLTSQFLTAWKNLESEKALTIACRIEKHIRKKHKSDYATHVMWLDVTGAVFSHLHNEEEAMKYFRRALVRLEENKSYGIAYAAVLYNMAASYRKSNDFGNALIYAGRSAGIYEEMGIKESTSYAKTIHLTGRIYLDKGDTSTAIRYMKHSLEILEKAEPDMKSDYAEVLSGISEAYREIGMLEKALQLQIKANTLILEERGDNSFTYASNLITTGTIYIRLLDFENAFTYTRQGIKIIEKLNRQRHPVYAGALDNLGTIYTEMGDYRQGLKYYQEGLQIKNSLGGKRTIAYYRTFMHIGNIYLQMKNPGKAFEQLLIYTEGVIALTGKSNLHYVRALIGLGRSSYLAGEYEKAANYFRDGLWIMQDMGLDTHPETARILHHMVRLCLDMRLPDIALGQGEDALDIIYALYGENHPDVKMYIENLALAHLLNENYPEAVNKYISILPGLMREVSYNFLFMTATERENYWGQIESYKNRSYTLLHHYPGDEFKGMNYDLALFTKGLLLNSAVEFGNFIYESGSNNMIIQYKQLQVIRKHIQDYYDKYDNPVAGVKKEIERLLEEAAGMERRLLEQAKKLGYYTENIAVSWKEIQGQMKEESVCIEFIDFSFLNQTYYGALVLRKDMEYPAYIPLFGQEELIHIGYGENSLTGINRLYNDYQLTRLIWGPLSPYIVDKEIIFFSTSGLLHPLAIEYLPVTEDTRMCDLHTLYRLSSTRTLNGTERETREPIDRKNAVLYGGLDYQLTPDMMQRYAGLYDTRNRIPGLNVEGDIRWQWSYLPGTLKEVRLIASLLKDRQVRTTIYTDAGGVEESFKILSGRSPHILHIATHGFYFPQESKYIKKTPLFYPEGGQDSTLYRSGLVFAGANNLKERKNSGLIHIDDGILTAREISEMDLRNTELVVLSACQTGLGEITGEGVFGLQRAFKKAGARTLLMSLWEAHDEATQVMMTEFYNGIASGFTKQEALYKAQQYVKERTFKMNGITYPGSDPYFWAGFIMLD